MVVFQSIRSLLLTGLLSLPVAGLTWLTPESARAQSISPQPADAAGQDLRPLTQESSVLSAQAGQRLMREAGAAVSAQNYDLAVRKLQEARQVFNSLSNFYQQLANSFSGIDIRIADQQRQQALAAAQSRDEATYQLALVHRAQNKPELAVPLLIQIISSQQPTRELGQRAYRQLFELGFVNSPFPRSDGGSTSSTPAPAPAPAPVPAPAPR
jgi:hypothetical protein